MVKMDNRHILGLCLVCVVVGSLLFGDWQAIGHDPCTSMTIIITVLSLAVVRLNFLLTTVIWLIVVRLSVAQVISVSGTLSLE